MLIKDIFAKDINRDIRGVIKIGQEADNIKKQELEEYVVTDELQQHFAKFFEAYVNSINHPTDATGVWISGFFGSGKSHFLKILSYLLKNEMVSGKRPIDYFRDDHKIKSEHTLEMIEQAEHVPTDVILFNIDAKADANADKDKTAILNVFLRVFNEQLGYDSNPVVADMERWLDNRGQYQAFKDAFYKVSHSHWTEVRNNFSFMKNSVKKALVDSGAMDEANAADYLANMNEFRISPEDFAGMVNKYLEDRGNDHHIIFMADEVGQFIGDNGDRMLNLQTIVEQLQTQCNGRAWVVVTSQQQMDEVTANFTNQKREDLSKIQGRFNTMINMSSANANEVIQKRLLEKKAIAEEALTDIFEENKYGINNQISFSDQVSRRKFDSADDFVTNYPFVPYQFDLLKDVLGAVRKHGAEGKHMSDGERSMLATFQAATKKYEDEEIGVLVPFSAFFRGMYEFLSHDHQVVFAKAQGNEAVCPDGNQDSFTMQVLEILFMVKYLDSFPATIENITTLLIDDVNKSREAVTKNVQESLETLVDQRYIQKNVDTYEFLTDKEQDINETISSYDVEDTRIVQRISEYLLSKLNITYTPKRMGNSYNFKFNVIIDDLVQGRANTEQSLRIYTPLNPSDKERYILSAQSGNEVVLVLPDDNRYIDAFRREEQIVMYLHHSANETNNQEKAIRLGKADEHQKLKQAAEEALENDLNDAVIYVMSDVLDDHTDINNRLNQAYEEVIGTSYRNLRYLTAVKSYDDIVQLLADGGANETLLDDNKQAVEVVVQYIRQKNGTPSMQNLREHFAKIPFGYNNEDTAWLVAKAFVDGKIRLLINNEVITLDTAKSNPRMVADNLTKNRDVKKLTIQIVREIPEKQKKAARDYVYDVLEKKSLLSARSKSTEELASDIARYTKLKIEELKGYQNFFGPEVNNAGEAVIDEGISMLQRIANSNDDSDRLYTLLAENIDDLEDWVDDMNDYGIKEFYSPNNRNRQDIWRRSLDYLKKYQDAQEFIEPQNPVCHTAEMIKDNLNQSNLSIVVPKLKDLNTQFVNDFSKLIDDLYQGYQKHSKDSRAALEQRLNDANFPAVENQKIEQQIEYKFNDHDKKAAQYSNEGYYTLLNNQVQLLDKSVAELNQLIDQTSQRLTAEAERAKRAKEQAQAERAEQEHTGSQEEVEIVQPVVVPKVKRTKLVDMSKLETSQWRITNEEDLDRYLGNLKSKLQEILKDNDIVNVDFK